MIEEQFEIENEMLLDKFQRKACNKMSKPSLGFHKFIALSLNIAVVLSASPFKILPKFLFGLYFIISICVTANYLQNYKSYSLFEFEELYCFIKKKSQS